MDDWELIKQELESVKGTTKPVVENQSPYIFTFRHRKSGDVRKVIATNEAEAGKKMANGEFYN